MKNKNEPWLVYYNTKTKSYWIINRSMIRENKWDMTNEELIKKIDSNLSDIEVEYNFKRIRELHKKLIIKNKNICVGMTDEEKLIINKAGKKWMGWIYDNCKLIMI